MAVAQVRFFSEALRESTVMTVILPESTHGQIGMDTVVPTGKTPVLYLLHGLSDDDSIWTRRTSIERYVAEYGIAVVMPRVGRSFYCDERWGGKYWTLVSEEIPRIIPQMFQVSTRREDTFVAGLSMGGYGAFKLAFHHPERFAAAASLSGALDVAESASFEMLRGEIPQVWGDAHPAGTDDDLVHLLRKADPHRLPSLYQLCGTEDFLYQDNLRFAEAARHAGLVMTQDLEGPGDHEWGYWDQQIQRVLHWMMNGHSHPTE
ncbi:alpha/beta hydrolase [Jonesia quinghaiensis]|uniref:alpha/beta hydrolase n=1 Tax=Jonesia quinghaiensis TaxID=262806 RepID=UPI000407D6AC|nr:alpha/beta hydrolase family protein [Jonesia quinghaiensis]